MEDNKVDYIHNFVEIHGEVFDRDFDDVGWDPVAVDDSDEEAAHEYGY